MQFEGLGSSVVIALAAVLWLVYLIPTWFRRREYLSTERNAVRLQQTLRIMAETAEIPEQVHLESSARAVAAQQKLLRQADERRLAVQRAREAMMSRDAARTLATLKPAVASEVLRTSGAARRLRRSRATTSVVLLASLGAIVTGLTVVPAAFASTVIVLGAGVAVASVGLLSWLAAVDRRRAAALRTMSARPAVARRVVVSEPLEPAGAAATTSWTPVPIPKPLYLSKPPVQEIVSEAAAQQERERQLVAAEQAERLQFEAERAEKVTPIRPSAPIAAPVMPSRFAGMGFVDAADTTVTDLDAVLRRRRAV